MILAAAGLAEMTPDDERDFMFMAALGVSIYPFFLLQILRSTITIAGGIQFLIYCSAAGGVIRSCDDHEWIWPFGVLGLAGVTPITFLIGGWFLGLLFFVALASLILTGLLSPDTSKGTKVRIVAVPIGYLLLNVASNILIFAMF